MVCGGSRIIELSTMRCEKAEEENCLGVCKSTSTIYGAHSFTQYFAYVGNSDMFRPKHH